MATKELEIVLRSPTPSDDNFIESPSEHFPAPIRSRKEPANEMHIELAADKRSASPLSHGDQSLNDTNVYVAGIPRRATEDDLREKFAPLGQIKSC